MSTVLNDREINLLFVDDEPMIVQSLTAIFRRQYNVFTATSGKEAIDVIRAKKIHIIISDQRMPGMMGHELLKNVKALSPSTIRILLTGYSDLESIINSVNAGEVFRYINKPWKVDSLRQTIKIAVDIVKKVEEMSPDGEAVAIPRSEDLIDAVMPSGSSVLFVDFNEAELKNLVRVFGKKYPVFGATSIDEALQYLTKEKIAVIVSDISMRSEEGIDFLNIIKQEYPHMVTVLRTEVQDAMLAIKSINELQVYRYLVKPCPEEVLDKTIQSAIQKHGVYIAQPMQNPQFATQQVAPEVANQTITEEKSNWFKNRFPAFAGVFGRKK
jgi:DNA-binding NtrC family response regulator